MFDQLSYLNNNQPANPPSLRQRLVSGLASGLNRYAENKLNQMQRQNQSQQFESLGLKPEVASFLGQLQETQPDKIIHVLENLSPDAYQEGFKPLFGKQASPLVEQKFEAKELAEERKLERDAAKKYIDQHQDELKFAKRLGEKAKSTLEFLNKHKEEQPSFGFRNIPPEYNPFAATSTHTLRALFNDLAGIAAAAEGKLSGFKSGRTLIELKERAKAAINQPYETQVQLLSDMIKQYEDLLKEDKEIRKIQAESKHKYPSDLMEKLKQFEESNRSSSNEEEVEERDGIYYRLNPATKKYDIELQAI